MQGLSERQGGDMSLRELFINVVEISVMVSVLAGLYWLSERLRKEGGNLRWRQLIWLIFTIRLALPLHLALPQIQESVQMPPVRAILEPLQFTAPQMLFLKPALMVDEKGISWLEILTALWAAGVGIVLMWNLCAGAVYQKRLRRWSVKTENVGVQRQKEQLGIKREISLSLCSQVSTPMLVGLFRPRLLLPTQGLSQEQIELAVRHELIHLKHHDLWKKGLLLWVRALHWFNPVVHWMAARMNQDMECYCDETVVWGQDMEYRRQYATFMLELMRKTMGKKRGIVTELIGGKNTMKERIEALFHMQQKKRGKAAVCIVLAVTLLGSVMLGCRNTASVGIIGGADGPTAIYITDENGENARKIPTAKELYEMRTPYVGNNAAVVSLLDALPIVGLTRGEVQLQTEQEPYVLGVTYTSADGENLDRGMVQEMFLKNAALMFCLVDNLGVVTATIETSSAEGQGFIANREELQRQLGVDFTQIGSSLEDFQAFYRQVKAAALSEDNG